MLDLDSQKTIANIDKQDMSQRLSFLPEEFAFTENQLSKLKLPKKWGNINRVAIVGMGASGIAGEIVENIYSLRQDIPIVAFHGYTLPTSINKNTLVVGISFSGETEETITAVKQAFLQKAAIFIIAGHESTLAKYAEKNNIPYFPVTAAPPPRFALPSLLIPTLIVLEKLKILNSSEVSLISSHSVIEKLIQNIDSKIPAKENEAKKLAQKLSGRMPIFVTSPQLSSVAKRAAQSINENSKQLAFSLLAPELSHNHIETLSAKNNSLYVLIKGSNDSPQIQKSYSAIESLLQKKKVPYETILLQGKNMLAQIWFGIVLLDYTSYYLALLNQENPYYNDNIDFYKKRLLS